MSTVCHLRKIGRKIGNVVLLAMTLLGTASHAEVSIDAKNWGSVTAPVYDRMEQGVFHEAELLPGPQKFEPHSYFHGVLPNGRIVKPTGTVGQIGQNPLGAILTPDGKFLITSNDDERNNGLSLLDRPGGYSLTVLDTGTMTLAGQISTQGALFIGLQIKGTASSGYTLYASGGASQSVKIFHVTGTGQITAGAAITIDPMLPANEGYVSHYLPLAGSQAATTKFKPTGYSTEGANITFPAGSAFSPDKRYLYVACNGDNSIAIIDTATNTLLNNRIAVGYFPYGVTVSQDGTRVFVSNWGVTEYKFGNVTYDALGNLLTMNPVNSTNLPDGFYLPRTSGGVGNPKTSSVSVISVPDGNPARATLLGAVYEGQPNGLDPLFTVGETHPSASAIVGHGEHEVLYVCKSNSDCIGMVAVGSGRRLPDFDLSPIHLTLDDGHPVHGAYPNAIVVSPDSTRAYVAEAGLNSVAVLDTSSPTQPRLLGRIPTGWYPTALALSSNGGTLYVINAKGIGEDINPRTERGKHNPTGIESFNDSNYIFGTAQKVELADLKLDSNTVLGYNFAVHTPTDTSIVPVGGAPSAKIRHVFFILGENKTFDSTLGDVTDFGPFASTVFNLRSGTPKSDLQFTGVMPNLHLLATTFATGVNYHSDSEESDAGHQFCSSGTCSDYTEKTLLVKSGRGMLVNKNFDAEDYPEGGYVYNNAARNGVSFRLYGLESARTIGADTGDSADLSLDPPARVDDPKSGLSGFPLLASSAMITQPVMNTGDVQSATQGVGQAFFMRYPALSVVGGNNRNGLPHLDPNYPGYNFNISDQRRALEFIRDFKQMVQDKTLPQFLYIYLPNMHTGKVTPPNAQPSSAQQVGDGDVALGMIVQEILNSPIYYNPADGTGSAILFTTDDAQSTLDHIHQHRSPLVVIGPYARVGKGNSAGTIGRGYVGKRHYSSASVVKTEELLLGLPPNNLGDLFVTDLRDLFQPNYNHITADAFKRDSGFLFNTAVHYTPSPEGRRISEMVQKLDTADPDQDSHRLGILSRLSMRADDLHNQAVKQGQLRASSYRVAQERLYRLALSTVQSGANGKDGDDD